MGVAAGWGSIRRVLLVVAALASVAVACGGTEESVGTPATSAAANAAPLTTTAPKAASADTAPRTGSAVPAETTAGSVDNDAKRVNAAAQQALDEAGDLWTSKAGEAYVWGYKEEGEGITVQFCVEAIATEPAGSDAAACPFDHESGGESVDQYFGRIQAMIDSAADFPGRTVEVEFDPGYGYPTNVVVSGGEVDGFFFSVVNFSAQGDRD